MIELPVGSFFESIGMVFGAFLESAGTLFEKKILKSKFMNFKNYTVYEFFAIVVVMSTFVWFFWKLDKQALELKNILIFGAVVLFAVIANLLIFYSLKREDITEFEPIWIMQPLFTIVLAFIFYSGERDWFVFSLALIASLALILSHVKKHHLVFDKYIIAALLGSFFFAAELVTSKLILQYYSPFSFYYLRCFFVLIITYLLFRPTFKGVGKKNWWMILSVGLTWAIYRAIMYYGYEKVGILYTTIIFTLSPVFTFLFAVIYLKEKPTWKQIAATLVIVICVILAVLFGKPIVS